MASEPGEMDGLLEFLLSEASYPTSKAFFEFALSEIATSEQTLLSAVVAALGQEQLTTKPPEEPIKFFSHLIFLEDEEFEKVFRITRKTFRVLQSELGAAGAASTRSNGIDWEWLLVLYCLGKSEIPDWAQVSYTFDLKGEEGYTAFVKASTTIVTKLKEKFIVWPKDHKRVEDIKMGLQRRYKFPTLIGILGAILLEENTLGLELVIDHNHRINWACALSEVSSPLELMELSGLRERVLERKRDSFILAGANYRQEGSLLTPYGKPSTREEEMFNVLHSKALGLIKEAGSLLSSRFPFLSTMKLRNPKDSKQVVEAACILHNICVDFNDMAPVVSR